MIRLLTLALTVVLCSSIARAQIIAVHFADEKHVSKYKNNVTYVNGEPVLVGEAYEGFEVDLSNGVLRFDPEGSNSLFISDPGDPTKVPYKYDRDGNKVPKSGKFVVDISGRKIRNVSVLIPDNTLAGLAEDYIFRIDELELMLDERDDLDKGSQEWMLMQARIVSRYERLQSWLQNTAYPEAAEDIEGELRKERKSIEKAGADERIRVALESITSVTTPENLIEIADDLTGGRIRFKVQESQHLRIIYQDSLSDSQVSDLLRLGERVIEAWRNEFVDPYLDEEYPDWIPDGVFNEWFFGPADIELYENFMPRYYGRQWGSHKEEALQLGGTTLWNANGLTCVNYWKLQSSDLEGIITNNLGGTLACLHYSEGVPQLLPPWLQQASGYYCSFEFLGRNTVTSMEFRDVKYRKEEGEEGIKTIGESIRSYFNGLALEEGPKLSTLAIKTLFEMEDADLAKAWSLFDYMGRSEGEDGQLVLRAHCHSGTRDEGMINSWREKANAILGVDGEDVFQVIEDRWRAYAERQ